MDIFRTLILPANITPLGQKIAATMLPDIVSMWTTGLSPTGAEPATHFISTGFISSEFASMVPKQLWEIDKSGAWAKISNTPGNPVAVYETCKIAGMIVTLEEIEAAFAVADVTEQEPFTAMQRMGLMLVHSDPLAK
jgi:hypothetical protein